MSTQAQRTTATDQRIVLSAAINHPVAFRRGSRSACGIIAALLTLALLAASASAAITHLPEPFSPLTGSGAGLTLTEPQGVAIDEATGNVFVTDETRVAILGGEGGAPAGLAAPFEIPGLAFPENNAAPSLAFDNSATSAARGTLYVSEGRVLSEGEIARVKKYARNPVTEKYEPAGELPISSGVRAGNLSIDDLGNLYVSQLGGGSEPGNMSRISVFSPAGSLAAEYEFPSDPFDPTPVAKPGQIAVDSAGNFFVAESSSGLYKFPAGPGGQIDPAVYTQVAPSWATGVVIDPSTDHIYGAFTDSIVEYDSTGAKVSQFGSSVVGYNAQASFSDATDRLYVADNGAQGNAVVNVFGPPVLVPTTTVSSASDVTGTKATLNGSVNPEGLAVTECFFEWGLTTSYGNTAPCSALPPTDSEPHPVHADISGLTADNVTYHFRLVAANANGKERSADQTLATAATVVTDPPTGLSPGGATLNGTVRPEGLQYSNCRFAYGLTTTAGFESATPCVPPAASIPPDFSPHSVSASLTGLQPNTAYKFRLTTTNPKGTLSGDTLTFITQGAPLISEIRARDADQSSATLEAKIDPRGFETSYHFEWGRSLAYGNSVPANIAPSIGSGEAPVRVIASLSGLSAGASYHYRIVARSAAGTTASTDHALETLNSCGLPEGRCFELVSRRDAGPVASPGKRAAGAEPASQAAPTGPGGLAYSVEAGYPESSTGGDVLYTARRDASGWSSVQFSAPLLPGGELKGPGSNSGRTRAISEDLSCGFTVSAQPLTADAGARQAVEAGAINLYRRNPDGGYTLVTKLPPSNPEAGGGEPLGDFLAVGISDACQKFVFKTPYHYSGISTVDASSGESLYEWSNDELRSVGSVPGGSGPVETGATATGPHAVSTDGSRVFFTAQRQSASNPLELEVPAIFVRERGTSTRDLSQSQGPEPSLSATFQYATADGSKVFFTSNSGLTSESSSEGTDLYQYDLNTGNLTDLSVSQESGGADVTGLLGASADGSVAYFAARGQLVPGKGRSFSENEAAKTYSVYRWVASAGVRYVGAIREKDRSVGLFPGVTVQPAGFGTSRVSADGRFLLFESSANVTGYETGSARAAYLYDAGLGGSGEAICVSCRQDDRPSVMAANTSVLAAGGGGNELYEPNTLVVVAGRPQVFFRSLDALAPGAVSGEPNLYLWSHDQVFRLVTEPPGLTLGGFSGDTLAFAGASSDGRDAYLVTPQSLTWEDGDSRSSVYDARIGGGFPEPSPPSAPCNATSEGACQGPSTPGTTVPGAGSATFVGPGNHRAKKHKKHKKKTNKGKHHKKKHQKHKKKTNKGKHKKKTKNKVKHRDGKRQNRAFDQDRRAGR